MIRQFSYYERLLRWICWKLDQRIERISDRKWEKLEAEMVANADLVASGDEPQ